MRISDWSSDVCSSDLIAAYLSLFKGLGGGVGSGLCGLFAAAHRGRFVREDLLRLVDLGALERLEPRDLVQRQIGEELQELADVAVVAVAPIRSEEHTSELQSLMRISYAVFCLKKKK